MISLKELLIVVSFLMIAGASVFAIVEDFGYLIACGGCKEGQTAVFEGIATLTSAGQNQVADGVGGIIWLREHQGEFKDRPEQFNLLLKTARNQVFGGTFLTLIYIFLFYMIISRMAEWTVGFAPPLLITLLLSVLFVGLITWAYGGFQGFPFDGWIYVATNWDVWSVRFLEGLSPLPLESFGNLSNSSNITL